jgi:ribonuclease HI
MDRDNAVEVWTDGSCNIADRTGGWAFHAEYGTRKAQRHGFLSDTTVNVMELTAIRRALEFIRVTQHPMIIYTDSRYAQGVLSGWRAVKNRELVEEILTLLESHRAVRSVEIKWIRGHCGHLNNERADLLAHEARVTRRTNWRASVENHLVSA